MIRRALFALIALFTAASARADTIEVGPTDDVEGAINALVPGDELVLQGGMYTLSDAWHLTIDGTEATPIVIRAKDGEQPHLHRPDEDQNVIDFDHVRYATFRGIEVSGGSHGLRLIDASFVTIEDCDIHDTGDVALSANSGGEYEGLVVRRNHIHDTGGTGEGMYIGCNDNGCQVHDSLFEANHIHHTNADDVEQGDGIEIKEGSYANVVRDNVIHDTNYPCIITYSTVGNGGPNVIERNLLWSCGDHAIQSAADAVIRNNVILGAAANGIANQPHQAGTPSNLVIVHNTILAPQNTAISSSGITGEVLIANNAVYAQSGSAIRVAGMLAGVTVRGNVGEGGVQGVSGGFTAGGLVADFVAASYSGAVPNDVFPRPGSALIGAGNAEDVPDDDFNGTARGGAADVGAYAFAAGGNPGWTLAPGFKPAAGTNGMPDGDAGTAGKDGGAAIGGSSGSGTGGSGGRAGSAAAGSGGGASGGGASGGAGRGGSGPMQGAGGRDAGAHATSDAGQGSGSADGGCSCRTAGARDAGAPWLALILLAAAGVARRRRRRRSAIVAAAALLALSIGACSDDDAGGASDAAAPGVDRDGSAGGSSGTGARAGAGGTISAGRGGTGGSSRAMDAGQRDAGKQDASLPRTDAEPSPAPDGGAFQPNPMLADLADETALDLGQFSCGQVPGEGAEECRRATDYSGFVYDPHHNAMLSFGGGHSTTMTDAVHVLDLGGALRWVDAYPPTPCASMTADNLDRENGAWLSGAGGPFPRPVSTHTYDMLAVAPEVDELIVIARTFSGGYCNPVGNDIGGKIAHFDRVRETWSFSPTADGSTSEIATDLPGSEPDPVSGLIVVFGRGGFSVYDPASREYEHVADTLADADGNPTSLAEAGYANHLVYFPPDDTFYLFVRGDPVDVYALKLDRDDLAQSTVERLDTTGPTSPHQEPSYDYDAVNRVIGGGVQDSTFYAFDPDTRTWTSHPMHGDPGTQAFHALAYDSVDNAFIFVTDYDSGQRTWAYRLAR